jgi:N-acetylmuramoyl-L-alanine amidase
MEKLFVIAGHSKSSPGATAYNGVSEYVYTIELQREVIDLLKGRFTTIVDGDEQGLTEIVKQINGNCGEEDLVIDLHFNNNNPKATGTEVFLSTKASINTRMIAGKMVRNISEALGIPVRRHMANRDYKYSEESARGKLAIIDNVKCESILIEVCFLNKRDLEKYNVEQAAKAIADSL